MNRMRFKMKFEDLRKNQENIKKNKGIVVKSDWCPLKKEIKGEKKNTNYC